MVFVEDLQLQFCWPNYCVFMPFCGAVLHFVELGLQDKTAIIFLVMWLEEEVVVDRSLYDCSQLY